MTNLDRKEELNTRLLCILYVQEDLTLDAFYIVCYSKIWAKTSWTYSTRSSSLTCGQGVPVDAIKEGRLYIPGWKAQAWPCP